MAAFGATRRGNLRVSPSIRDHLGWILAATVTAWMAATLLAVLGVVTGIAAGTQATEITAIGTAAVAAVLYRRFRHLGRVDEPLVLCLLVCWAVTLGLLSL